MQAHSVIISEMVYAGGMTAGRPSKFERSGFGERLFRARQQTGLSQIQVAERLKVTQQTYAGWERRTTALKPEYISQLADIMHVSPDYLLGRNAPPQRGTGPAGKMRTLFEAASCLPRNQQQKVIALLDAFVAQHTQRATS